MLAAIVLTACRSQPVAPFTLRIAVSGTLAPMGPGGDLRGWTRIIQPCVFDTLVGIGTEGDSVPVLAARTEITASHALRLWVRSDARFSDGSPVTFADVAQSVAAEGLRATEEPGEGVLISGDESAGPLEL
ncbi:MAG TPA: hypothetical protein VLW85_23245, partial [Myxococcales bacterium]|nr:hypothetical protein [Myxococcales bacterium]